MTFIDVLAAIAVVVGAALTALGAIGLLRFPDVFTRMHAATKAATVGVIAATGAAAAEAGAMSGVLVLLLVAALLFLSGPLGMSLLARAAFHDPETPRAPNTRELDVTPPIAETTTSTARSGTSPFLAVWLFVIWVALFGSLRPNVVVGGIAVSGTVAYLLRRIAPRWPHALLHPVAAARFTAHFSVQLAASTWDVVRLLWRPTATLEPAVVAVPLLVPTRNELTLLMNAISFTPGTVAFEVHHDRLTLHVLSTKAPEAVVEEVAVLQRLIMDAFGAPDRRRRGYHATDDV